MGNMADRGLDRVAELWPKLRPEVRAAIEDIAEKSAVEQGILLTAEERASIARAEADFDAGRVLGHEDLKASIKRYLDAK